jgi:hypothetical protein
MSRVNKGKHIIISDEVHTNLKSMCTRAGVRMTDVADTVLVDFIRLVESSSFPSEQDTILRTAAARRERVVKVEEKEVPTSEPAAVQGGDAPVAPKDEAQAHGTGIPQ